MAQFDVQIEKMHCGACVRRVAQALNSLPATHADSVAVGAATITTQAPTAAVLEALQQAGFPAHIVAERS